MIATSLTGFFSRGDLLGEAASLVADLALRELAAGGFGELKADAPEGARGAPCPALASNLGRSSPESLGSFGGDPDAVLFTAGRPSAGASLTCAEVGGDCNCGSCGSALDSG
mmetsp:Transcript_70968/g.159363  ORF Transcript_70968/g.159363 Transcript_70968/m.159363 type:complete len:112 (-) Transcript_70968:22-357(-)